MYNTPWLLSGTCALVASAALILLTANAPAPSLAAPVLHGAGHSALSDSQPEQLKPPPRRKPGTGPAKPKPPKKGRKGKPGSGPTAPPPPPFGPKVPAPVDPWQKQKDEALKKKADWDAKVKKARQGTWNEDAYGRGCKPGWVRGWGKSTPVTRPCTAETPEQAVGMCSRPDNQCKIIYVCNHLTGKAIEVRCDLLPTQPDHPADPWLP
jgi:hypothetical protein